MTKPKPKAPAKKAAPTKKRPAPKTKPKSATAPKRPRGHPTDFKPEYVAQAQGLSKLGATDLEIADFFGVDVRTIYRWKATHAKFCQSITIGKKEADDRVERSLFARANGYEHNEVDIRVVNGAVVQTPIRKFYPPDTAAAIFWLKNRRRDSWRDKVDHEVGGPDGQPLQVVVKRYSDA